VRFGQVMACYSQQEWKIGLSAGRTGGKGLRQAEVGTSVAG
jgi:hypothetical protein